MDYYLRHYVPIEEVNKDTDDSEPRVHATRVVESWMTQVDLDVAIRCFHGIGYWPPNEALIEALQRPEDFESFLGGWMSPHPRVVDRLEAKIKTAKEKLAEASEGELEYAARKQELKRAQEKRTWTLDPMKNRFAQEVIKKWKALDFVSFSSSQFASWERKR